jgi:hypothetical protein
VQNWSLIEVLINYQDSTVLLQLYAQGLESSEVVVPVIACTGLCMVIGAVTLLEEYFPTYIPLSKR